MKYILCMLAAFALIACNRDNTIKPEKAPDYPIRLDLTDIRNEQSVSLSQIADSISYIKLETNSESYLSAVNGLEMDESFIYVSIPAVTFRFSANGDFISDVNTVGKGQEKDLPRILRSTLLKTMCLFSIIILKGSCNLIAIMIFRGILKELMMEFIMWKQCIITMITYYLELEAIPG